MLEGVDKCSKTDSFRWGVEIYLGQSSNELYPVAAIVAYLKTDKIGWAHFFSFTMRPSFQGAAGYSGAPSLCSHK